MASGIDYELEELKSLFEEIDGHGPESSEVGPLLTEAENTIKQIKIQSHSVTDQTKKDSILTQVAAFEAKVRDLKKSQLLAGGSKSKASQKTTMDPEDQQQQSMETLRKAHRELQETEAVGNNVLKNLALQKETIANSNKNLKETNQHLSYSKKLINGMSQWWR